MRALHAALSPLLAAWLFLLAGITPAHCLLRLSQDHALCSAAAALDQRDPAPGADMTKRFCLVCTALPTMPPPQAPVLAGPVAHAAPRPPAKPGLVEARARAASLPPARAPPAAA